MTTNLLKSLLLCISVFLTISGCEPQGYRFKRTENRIKDPEVHKRLQPKIREIKVFAEDLISEYFVMLRREINSAFWNSFLIPKMKVNVGVLFSDYGDSLVYFFPSPDGEFILEHSPYPAEFVFFGGYVDFKSPDKKQSNIDPTWIDSYKKVDSIANGMKAGVVAYFLPYGEGSEPPTIIFHYPKVFGMEKKASIVTSGIRYRLVKKSDPPVDTLIDGILVINGKNNLDWMLKNSRKIASSVFKNELSTLIEKSEFFRKALGHWRLESKAREFQAKVSRAAKDPEFDYPLWKIKEDVCELKTLAKSEGLDTSYVDELLRGCAVPQDGVLFWYYPNLTQFMLQWTIVNVFLFLLFLIMLVPRWRFWFQKPFFKILPLVPVSVNGWIFYQKPDSAGLKYWIIPGIVFILSFLLAYRVSAQNPSTSLASEHQNRTD